MDSFISVPGSESYLQVSTKIELPNIADFDLYIQSDLGIHGIQMHTSLGSAWQRLKHKITGLKLYVFHQLCTKRDHKNRPLMVIICKQC